MRRIARGVVDAVGIMVGYVLMTVVLVLAIAVLPVIVLACIVVGGEADRALEFKLREEMFDMAIDRAIREEEVRHGR